jgi:hypothetical protein
MPSKRNCCPIAGISNKGYYATKLQPSNSQQQIGLAYFPITQLPNIPHNPDLRRNELHSLHPSHSSNLNQGAAAAQVDRAAVLCERAADIILLPYRRPAHQVRDLAAAQVEARRHARAPREHGLARLQLADGPAIDDAGAEGSE